MKTINTIAIAVAGALLALPAVAQTYPERPVTVIVPFGAGGGTDAVGRVLAEALSIELDGRFVIDNRGGANGSIGASAVARAAPDGYTLLMTTSTTHAANPSLMRELSYDPVADFDPIARIGYFPFILAINADLPAETVSEFLAYGETNPDTLSYAYWQGTTIVAGATFQSMTGADLLGVSYPGTTPAVADVLAGRVSAIFVDVPSGLSHIEAGTLRPLAVTTAQRSEILPDIPSMSEAGVEGYDVSSWMAFYAPAGTPEDVIEMLSAATLTVLEDEGVRERLAGLGFDVVPSNAAELADYTVSEIENWRQMVDIAGIEPQ